MAADSSVQILFSDKTGNLYSASLQGLLLLLEKFYYRKSPLRMNTITYCFTATKLTFRIQMSPASAWSTVLSGMLWRGSLFSCRDDPWQLTPLLGGLPVCNYMRSKFPPVWNNSKIGEEGDGEGRTGEGWQGRRKWGTSSALRLVGVRGSEIWQASQLPCQYLLQSLFCFVMGVVEGGDNVDIKRKYIFYSRNTQNVPFTPDSIPGP